MLHNIQDKSEGRVFEPVEGRPKPKGFWWWEPPAEFLPVDFCTDSGLHGLKYISQPQRHITERIFWLFSFLAGISAAVYLITDAWRKYKDNPVIIGFQAHETPIDQIPFPAVTLCNMNNVLKSKAEKYIETARQANLANITIPGARLNLYYLDHVCSTSPSFSKRFNYSSTIGAIDPKLMDWIKEERLRGSTEKFLRESAQTCGDMIKLCLWKGQPRNCTDLFRPIETDFGKCGTFNMVPKTLLHRYTNDSRDDPETVNRWLNFVKNENWGVGEIPQDRENDFPYRQNKGGSTSGLSILLNPDLDEYYCATSDGKGFRLSVHKSTDFPHVVDYGHAIEPDTEAYVSIRSDITMAGSGLHRVPLNKRQCYFKGEKELHYFSMYTANNCVDECIANLTNEQCNCVRYFMPREPQRRICSPRKLACTESARQRIYRYGINKVCTACLPVCSEIDYTIETSMTKIRNEDIWVDNNKNSAEWSTKNVSIVHVYFGQESTYARERKELYGVVDLIANQRLKTSASTSNFSGRWNKVSETEESV